MPKPVKVDTVKKIQDQLDKAQMVIFVDYRGLTVTEVTDLRKKLRDANVAYKVYKNTLVKIAADNLKYSGLEEALKGPTAVAFSEEPINPSKIMFKFAKDNKALEIKGAVYEKKFLDTAGVQKFSSLMSKEEALTTLAVMLNSITAGFARAVEAVRKQKEEAAPKAEEKPAAPEAAAPEKKEEQKEAPKAEEKKAEEPKAEAPKPEEKKDDKKEDKGPEPKLP